MNRSNGTSDGGGGKRRVAPLVALALMERIREQDLPSEVFEEENTTLTMPRRFGLSDVVLNQIQQLERDVKRKRRLTDEELGALFRLVIRRPDSSEIFFAAGEELAARAAPASRLQRLLPSRFNWSVARRRTRRTLRALFGSRVGTFASEPFALEGRQLLFVRSDPGGEACELVTGLCQGILRGVSGGEDRIAHDQCESRGDTMCRWSVLQVQPVRSPRAQAARVPLDRLAEPDPGVAPARSRLPEQGTAAAS